MMVSDLLVDLVYSLEDGLVEIAVKDGVLAGVEDVHILSVDGYNAHFFSGHGAGLAKAELVDLANVLNRLEITDENVVVLVHEKYGVGERD